MQEAGKKYALMSSLHAGPENKICILFSPAGLTHLDFSSPGDRRDEFLSNTGIAALAPLTNLKSLSLAGHLQLTPEGLGFLSECTGLTALDLAGAGNTYSDKSQTQQQIHQSH